MVLAQKGLFKLERFVQTFDVRDWFKTIGFIYLCQYISSCFCLGLALLSSNVHLIFQNKPSIIYRGGGKNVILRRIAIMRTWLILNRFTKVKNKCSVSKC